MAKSIGRGLISLIPLALSAGLNYAGDRAAAAGHPGYANTLHGAGSGMAIGSTIGSIVGAIGGGILGFIAGGPAGALAGAGLGATIGSIAGGTVGGTIGALHGANQPLHPETKNATDKLTKALDDNTKAVQLQTQNYGGGKRTSAITTQAGAEYAWAYAQNMAL